MAKPIVIKVDTNFEEQDKRVEFVLDFKKTKVFKIQFADGYHVIIEDKTEHILNDTEVEANLYDPDNMKKSTNWVGAKPDEVGYVLYNWFMILELKNAYNIYSLIFERGRLTGGGFL